MTKLETAMSEEHKWDDWNALLTWATWEVMSSITRGKPLCETMHTILDVARRAEFKAHK